MRWPWARPEWRPDPGTGYDLRQYYDGRPTGLVAMVGLDRETSRCETAIAPDVRLTRERSWLVIEERGSQPGEPLPVRMRVPLRACVEARAATEPGLLGREQIRFSLTVRIGEQPPFAVSFWFPAECGPFLHRLVNEIDGVRRPSAPPTPQSVQQSGSAVAMPQLVVRQAPCDDEWVAFRSVDDGEVLLRPPAAQVTAEGRQR